MTLVQDPRVVVIGCGSIGLRHLENLVELGIEVVAVVDPDAERRRVATTVAPVVAVPELGAALALGPNTAIIATPTSEHVRHATLAARAGCHLFVEKPLSHSLDGVDELRCIVREQSLVTLVGCNMRFHPVVARVAELIRERAIGRVLSARLEVGQYLPDWRPAQDYRRGYSASAELGGGVLLDAIHELDLAMWFFGRPAEVASFVLRVGDLEIETEDLASLLVRFRSGVLAEIHLDYLQRAHVRGCQIVGNDGTIVASYADLHVRVYTTAAQRWKTECVAADWKPNRMYLDELTHFLRCLRGDETPALDLDGATDVLKLALAAKDASVRRTVVRVPGDP